MLLPRAQKKAAITAKTTNSKDLLRLFSRTEEKFPKEDMLAVCRDLEGSGNGCSTWLMFTGYGWGWMYML